MKKIIVTGGMGFIGSALVRELISCNYKVLNIDSITYAATADTLKDLETNENYLFIKENIKNYSQLVKIFKDFCPNTVIHLAAETHVDRSIDSPINFLETNIIGTFNLLDISYKYWVEKNKFSNFRFHHVSTDEVYGDLTNSDDLFTEETRYFPSSPYAASKASSDHLVRAWYRTYGLPTIISNCSNNYGPYQFPEKLIPHIILNAIQGKSLPIYGNGLQIRDWLYVNDHAKAIIKIFSKGKVGNTYNVGGLNQKTNLEVVENICEILENLAPTKPKGINKYRDLITFVKDRPGHDKRYAIDATKITSEIGWLPEENFDSGLRKSVKWYLDNSKWWKKILSGSYTLERIGIDNE